MATISDPTVVLRAAVAAAVGFMIGREREAHGSPAGDRTLALVALGSALLTALGVCTFPENADRVIGGVITGIGFLGTGVHTASNGNQDEAGITSGPDLRDSGRMACDR